MLENETGLDATNSVHLTFTNLEGSVEHYYHFLLGFFVPMVIVCEKWLIEGNVKHVFVQSCGLFDDFIRLTGCPEITILDKDTHLKMKHEGALGINKSLPIKFIEYDGYDTMRGYDLNAFNQVSTLLNSRYFLEIAKAKEGILLNRHNQGPFIVFIDRKELNFPFFSDECELKTSGNHRRSIENIDELRIELIAVFPEVICTTLEGKTLFYQIALFAIADVIIAQHGAALSNLIWCSSKATLIEILPEDKFDTTNGKSCFTHLAACMSLQFKTVRQKGVHGDADLDMLVKALHSIYPDNKTLRQRLFLDKESRREILPELFPVYGDEYKIIVRKDEFYIQAADGSLKAQLTPSAALIFNACLGNKNIGQIVSNIKALYPDAGTKPEIQKDVIDVIDELIEKDIIDLKKVSPFPDFIIIGAMKSGTSTLFNNLASHPEVYMAYQKDHEELRYFHCKNWRHGNVWYRKHFSANKKLQGEKTPLYMSSESAILEMHDLLPDAKLIVLLRDPVTRAFSHWNHFNQVSEISEKWGWRVCDFEQCLKVEPDVLSRGHYAEQLDFLFQLYPRDQVYIGIAEKFRADGLNEYRKVCEFLDIEMSQKEYNSYHVRKYSSNMSKNMLDYLSDYYEPHNRALFELLGYSIDEWRN